MDEATERDKKARTATSPWLPPWRVLIAFAVVVLASFPLGYMLRNCLVRSYLETKRQGPNPVATYVWGSVDYPAMLGYRQSEDEIRRHMVVRFGLEPSASISTTQTGTLQFAIVPQTEAVRIVDKDGLEISGGRTITLTTGTSVPSTFYLDTTYIADSAPYSFDIVLLEATLTPSCTMPCPTDLGFEIQQESATHAWFRRVTQAVVPWTNWVTFLLGILAAAAKWVLERAIPRLDDMEKLRIEIEQTDSNETRRDLVNRYHRDMRRFPLRNRRIDAVARELQEELNRENVEKALIEALDILQHEENDRVQVLYQQLELARHGVGTWLVGTICARFIESNNVRIRPGAPIDFYVELGNDDLGEMERVYQGQGTDRLVRLWIVRLLAHIQRYSPSLVNRAKQLLTQATQDPDIDIRAEASWGLLQTERDPSPRIPLAGPNTMVDWLESFPQDERLLYNPFQSTTAEQENATFNVAHYYPHPLSLHIQNSIHQIVIAAPGGGKTTLRLHLKDYCRDNNILAVEYTDFERWQSVQAIPAATVHVDRIVRLCALAFHSSAEYAASPMLPCDARLEKLVETARNRGYQSVWVLVDNVGTACRTETDYGSAERTVRSLLMSLNTLCIPGLTMKAFLPAGLEQYVRNYDSVARGWIEIAQMEWTDEMLDGVIRRRLARASRDQIDNLGDMTAPETRGTADIQKEIVASAGRNPRHLIQQIALLFRYRAHQWRSGGKSREDLWCHPRDRLYAMEWMIQHRQDRHLPG